MAIDSRQNVIGETMSHNSVPVVIGSRRERTGAPRRWCTRPTEPATADSPTGRTAGRMNSNLSDESLPGSGQMSELGLVSRSVEAPPRPAGNHPGGWGTGPRYRHSPLGRRCAFRITPKKPAKLFISHYCLRSAFFSGWTASRTATSVEPSKTSRR